MSSSVPTDKETAVSHVEGNDGLQPDVSDPEYAEKEKDGMHDLALDIAIDPRLDKSIT